MHLMSWSWWNEFGEPYIMKKNFVVKLILAMLLGVSATVFSAANPFSDVPAGHWAYNSVAKLAAEGVIEGYGDGTFRGDRNITRYEMATLLARMPMSNSVSPEVDGTNFSDMPKVHWAHDSVMFLAEKGVSQGYGDGSFRGDRNITRYETAVILAKALRSM